MRSLREDDSHQPSLATHGEAEMTTAERIDAIVKGSDEYRRGFQAGVEAQRRAAAPATAGWQPIAVCVITGRIAGDADACGDCDPCSAAHAVPEVVKRLLAEKEE